MKREQIYCDSYQEKTRKFRTEPPIKPTDTVMLGDSLTQFGGNWNQRLLDKDTGPYINRGIAGDDTDGIYDRLDQILPYQPATIFFLAGINDISHDLSIKEVANGIFKIVDEISRQCPNTRLYLQSLLPINEDFHQWKLLEGKTEVIPQVNRIIHKMANERNISYLNLFSLFSISGLHIMRPDLTIDGLHLTEKGYDVWSKKLKEEPL
ncbi:MAG: GDSL-type esterase/lipase family protein [Prevotella sp.]